MSLELKDPVLLTRLGAVLQAAIKAPGYWPRLYQAGLVVEGKGNAPAELAPDWPERFTQLPILTKDVLRQCPGQFLAGVEDVVYKGSTSGSRGQSYLFFAGLGWNQQRLRSRQNFLDWWGIGPEVPIVNLASRLMPGRPADLTLAGQITPACLQELRQLLGLAPVALRGYPSRLCDVASYLQPPLPPVKAVICTGEPLFEHQRLLLESVFQAPVINEYGCHEAAATGFSCPVGGRIHLDEGRCLYEIIDHHLVTTDLWNQTMPLIRYQSGDLVRRHCTPCPCGCPGMTVELLGRMEDRVNTCQGLQPTGNVAMPPLPGLLHYRVQRLSPSQVAAWVQPVPGTAAATVESALRQWIYSTFGQVDLEITSAPATLPLEAAPLAWSDRQWIETITQHSLGAWLSANAMPTGAAQPAATLLKTLLNPQVIGLGGSKAMLQPITRLAATAPTEDGAVETIRQRVLLLACSAITDGPAAQALYDQICSGFKAASPPAPATQLDGLIPSLYLPPAATRPLWEGLDLTAPYPLDPLNAHHLLVAFDTAIQQRPPRQRSALAQALNPLLAVLVGDLSFWAPQFTLAHLEHWVALVQGEAAHPCTPPRSPSGFSAPSSFLGAWLTWRQSLLCDPAQATAAWQTLQQVATSAAEQGRLSIERGYHHLIQGQRLDPDLWLPILNTQAGWDVTAPTPTAPALTPWLPIIRALAQPLHQRGQVDWAYHCLVAATLPSRQSAIFDRLTSRFNQKQSVLVDLSPWSED